MSAGVPRLYQDIADRIFTIVENHGVSPEAARAEGKKTVSTEAAKKAGKL
ncbi:MAG: hypothetical protein WB622_13820 [Acidobacteriaceae bacterium]|jgi:hypothetical protein